MTRPAGPTPAGAPQGGMASHPTQQAPQQVAHYQAAQYQAAQNPAGQNPAAQNPAAQNQSAQNQSAPYQAAHDPAAQYQSAQNQSAPNQAAQNQAPYGAPAPQGQYAPAMAATQQAAPTGPYPNQPGAYAAPPQAPYNGPPPVQAPTGPADMAMRRTSFLALVRVELRKLSGTMSDRILLLLGPLVIIGVTVLIHSAASDARDYGSAADQISPTFYVLRLGHVLLHAVLIKLIAGEWQHRSAQPTLLVQPSRTRYFLAQATVVLMLWALCAVLQLATTLVVAPGAVAGVNATYLLGMRVDWVVGVCLIGSLLTILVALTVSMLLPNAAGALAVYFASVPVMATLAAMKPEFFIWIDPSAATFALATLSPVPGPGPVIVSLLLWGGLLVLAGVRVARRDVA